MIKKLIKVGFSAIVILSLSSSSAFAGLSYPGDCKNSVIKKAASKGGCSVKNGSNHQGVYKDGQRITTFSHHVKANGTCRSIIKAINKHCK